MIKEFEELNSNNFDVVADEIVADGAVLPFLIMQFKLTPKPKTWSCLKNAKP